MSYAGFFQTGSSYQPSQRPYSSVQADIDRQDAMRAYRGSVDGDREAYERRMAETEQQRRQFDSETQREGQQMKYGVLSSLLSGDRGPVSPYGDTGMRSLRSTRVESPRYGVRANQSGGSAFGSMRRGT